MLRNDHVHALLVVDHGRLLTVVERAALTFAPAHRSALHLGRLDGRVVGPDVDLHATWQWMGTVRRRRLTIADPAGRLLGLPCLEHSRRGFCTT
jgi:hypothetical protein